MKKTTTKTITFTRNSYRFLFSMEMENCSFIIIIPNDITLIYSSDDNDDEEQEARLLNIIGEKAIENGDYKTANDLSIQIMDRNLGHGKSGWKLCYQICCLMNKELEFESLLTIDQRLRILSFVLAHCPDTDVNMHYDLLNQLKNLKQLHVNYLIEPKIYINFHNGQSTTLVQ